MFSTEKILAVYEETTILNEQLKKAVRSANKIRTINDQEENVSKIINDFNIIKDNNKTLIKETDSAINHIKKISSPLSFSMFIMIFLSCFLAGMSLGYLTFTSYLKDTILVSEINKVKEIQNKHYNRIQTMVNYEEKGFIFYNTSLRVPNNFVISDTQAGNKAIFFD